ncbi:MAG: GNAT family N-acetyltransferase [Proteobacteria bacterium]|nr:GNAT family N-acetyltransferase [Pseudomonadota bacterium]
MTAPLRFHIQTGLSRLELGLLWRDLEARADPTFFLSWDWIGAWLAELEPLPPVVVGEAGGALVLLGALVPHRRVEGGIVRVDGLFLHTTGERAKDVIAIEYNGFLVDRAWTATASAAAVDWLLGAARVAGRRRAELHVVAACAEEEARLVPPGMLLQVPSRKPSWRVDLDPVRAAGGDDRARCLAAYLATLGANTRQQIRRSMRLYEETGPLVAERAEDAATGLAFLDALAALHQAQWEARGEPGGFAFPFFERFQRRLVETCLPHGTVELLRISRGGTPIGYLFNLVYRGHVLAFVSGFRFEDDPRLKPGLICHALAIARHAAEGVAIYDFLAGAARYKGNLGRPGPEFVYLLIQRPTAMTRTERQLRRAWTGLRPALRRLAPRR